MRKILLLVIFAALGWKGYEKYSQQVSQLETVREHAFEVEDDLPDAAHIDFKRPGQSVFNCDGRTYCSQMKSCEEAKYFLQHCPNVKMDGNNDGVPCETQWCT